MRVQGGCIQFKLKFPRVRISACYGNDPYEVLGVTRNSSQRAVREAYLKKIKLLHPDLNLEKDTTEAASIINIAYEAIVSDKDQNNIKKYRDGDIFDFPESAPNLIFINPFSCQRMSPLFWRKIQEIARSSVEDPLESLSLSGISVPDSAVHYLTPLQLQEVEEELEKMEANFSFETCEWWLSNCLMRASRANYMFNSNT